MSTITTGVPVTWKEAQMRGEILAADTYKIGLFRANASLGRSYGPTVSNTVKYTDITTATSDEVASGGGYTTGGNTLATYASGPNNATPTVITGTGAWIDWTVDPTWTSATFVASGCFIYDNTHANKLIAYVIDFGGDKSVTSGTLTLILPTPGSGTAILVGN
jgi:hypothetical protein